MDFIALGGTNKIGASSYYINLSGKNFLLDCGKGIGKNNLSYGPDLSILERYTEMISLAQIDAIFISHAHYDHIGYLPILAEQCQNTPIFSTKISKELGKYLMYDKYLDNIERIEKEQLIDKAFARIHPIGYSRSFKVDDIKITFFEAGHIPGAAMIYFESPERNVLYTGDFMKDKTKLTSGYKIANEIKPDIIIMCGLHAKHPYYQPPNILLSSINQIAYNVSQNIPLYISVQQLTKGIETIQIIKEKMQTGIIPQTEIFIDDYIWNLAERLGLINLKILANNCSRFPKKFMSNLRPGIYIGERKNSRRFSVVFEANFSLHASYNDYLGLINKYLPSVVFVVHSPEDGYYHGNDALKREFPNLQIIYPELGHKYSDTNQKGC